MSNKFQRSILRLQAFRGQHDLLQGHDRRLDGRVRVQARLSRHRQEHRLHVR